MRVGARPVLASFLGGLLLAVAASGFFPFAAAADVEREMATGVNIPGGDIASGALQVPDPGLCRQACDQNSQCLAWTFVKPGIQGAQAMCWLKGTIGQSQRDPNTISGVKPNSGGPAPGASRVENMMSLGYDLPGADIASFTLPRGDPSLCQQACDGRGDCRSWTFVKPGAQGPQAICFLKGGVPTPVANDNVISGLRLAALPPPPPPGGGGGSGGGGGAPEWGVWASASGGRWSDPCAIQYNAAQVPGNRYDGNPGYRRVRTRPNQREADLDIDHFGRYHRDQPDGVVKMTPCEADQVDGGGGGRGGGPGGGGPGGQNPYAQWMTGNFNSSFGAMTLSPGGGTYPNYGRIQVTAIEGAMMTGIWVQADGQRCADGQIWGRLRFTFTASGFTGSWGRCEGGLNEAWNGTRQ